MTRMGAGGRPRIALTPEALATARYLAGIACTAKEIASVLGISVRTLDRRLRESGLGGSGEFIKKHSAPARVQIRAMLWNAVEAGNVTAMIWLGKQLLRQKEPSRTELRTGGGLILTAFGPAPDAPSPRAS